MSKCGSTTSLVLALSGCLLLLAPPTRAQVGRTDSICWEEPSYVLVILGRPDPTIPEQYYEKVEWTVKCTAIPNRHPYSVPAASGLSVPLPGGQAVGPGGKVSGSPAMAEADIAERRALLEEGRAFRNGNIRSSPGFGAPPLNGPGSATLAFPEIPPKFFPRGKDLSDEFAVAGYPGNVEDPRAPVALWDYLNKGLQQREALAYRSYEDNLFVSVGRTSMEVQKSLLRGADAAATELPDVNSAVAAALAFLPDNTPLAEALIPVCLPGPVTPLVCKPKQDIRPPTADSCSLPPLPCPTGEFGFRSVGEFRARVEALATRYKQIAPAGGLNSLAQPPSIADNRRRDVRAFGLGALYEADLAQAGGDDRTAGALMRLAETMLDVGIGLVPILSVTRDIYEVFTGTNLLTGQALSDVDYTLAVVGIITVGISNDVIASSKAARTVINEVNPAHLRRFETTLAEVSDWWVEAKAALGSAEGASLELSGVLRNRNIDAIDRSSIIRSFDPKSIEMKVAGPDTRVWRYHNDDAIFKKDGRFVAVDISNDVAMDRARLAIPSGNRMGWLDERRITPGTVYFEGAVRPDFGSPGGGRQAFVPDPAAVAFVRSVKRPPILP